ncbi:MAG: hypothetical protein D6725_04790 [Planctomycetota bacterium]|nr:MAG: hypothetical protein D6725_04790 [Planctomycetota bacterium]
MPRAADWSIITTRANYRRVRSGRQPNAHEWAGGTDGIGWTVVSGSFDSPGPSITLRWRTASVWSGLGRTCAEELRTLRQTCFDRCLARRRIARRYSVESGPGTQAALRSGDAETPRSDGNVPVRPACRGDAVVGGTASAAPVCCKME